VLKDAAEQTLMTEFLKGSGKKEELWQQALVNPQFFVLSGGGSALTNGQGVPWSGTYVDANGDLTVDLRSNLASESRAKIVYEYLLQFTDDPHIKDTLNFLMTREVAHYKMFASALDSVQPNFPPGVLQGDPRYSRTYFNLSDDGDIRGPWNEGKGAWESARSLSRQLGKKRSEEIKSAVQADPERWSHFANGSRSTSISGPDVGVRVDSK
jgi:Mn-containing catalase